MAQQPQNRLEDDSDWWSYARLDGYPKGLKAQHKTPATSNFVISSIPIGSQFDEIRSKLGPAEEVTRGDAAVGRSQICYASLRNNMHLIFEFGEVDSIAYLFKGGPDWNGSGRCTKSNKVSVGLATDSGLKLGMTPEAVINTLGPPSLSAQSKLLYLFEYEQKTPSSDLARLRKENPQMNEEDFRKNFETHTVKVYIETRFVSSRLSYLAIARSEVY